METFAITAEKREDFGKNASRRLRRKGQVPGVLYGSKKEAVSIVMDHNEIMQHLKHEAFHSHILQLTIGKKTEDVILKEVQHHPYKLLVLHLDLHRINKDQKLTIRVPFHFLNEENCVGVKRNGGVISHILTDLEIVCLPKDLPEYIEIDTLDLDLGDGIYISDLKLPKEIEISILLHGGDAKQVIVSVHTPKVIEEPEPVVTEEAEEVDPAADTTDTPSSA